MDDAWPTELRLDKDKRVLSVTFDDGRSFALPAELLRVLSPSAEVQGHSPEQRVTVGGKKNVSIVRLEPVGNYAVRIVFDDGHDTGLFVWEYLRELGENREARWQDYLQDLAAKRLSR
ncbi:MAG: gamma-butyrobetaine hydroxylase-like domain-containing protein [Methyloceanibacter sp.]